MFLNRFFHSQAERDFHSAMDAGNWEPAADIARKNNLPERHIRVAEYAQHLFTTLCIENKRTVFGDLMTSCMRGVSNESIAHVLEPAIGDRVVLELVKQEARKGHFKEARGALKLLKNGDGFTVGFMIIAAYMPPAEVAARLNLLSMIPDKALRSEQLGALACAQIINKDDVGAATVAEKIPNPLLRNTLLTLSKYFGSHGESDPTSKVIDMSSPNAPPCADYSTSLGLAVLQALAAARHGNISSVCRHLQEATPSDLGNIVTSFSRYLLFAGRVQDALHVLRLLENDTDALTRSMELLEQFPVSRTDIARTSPILDRCALRCLSSSRLGFASMTVFDGFDTIFELYTRREELGGDLTYVNMVIRTCAELEACGDPHAMKSRGTE